MEPLTGIALLIGASSVSAIGTACLPIVFGIPGGSGFKGYRARWFSDEKKRRGAARSGDFSDGRGDD